MNATETLAHLRALTDPTPEQLRKASDLALLATGWRPGNEYPEWRDPKGGAWLSHELPHPCADVQDAIDWMVPEGYGWAINWDTEVGGSKPIARANTINLETRQRPAFPEGANTPALALTIAGLAATLESEK